MQKCCIFFSTNEIDVHGESNSNGWPARVTITLIALSRKCLQSKNREN